MNLWEKYTRPLTNCVSRETAGPDLGFTSTFLTGPLASL